VAVRKITWRTQSMKRQIPQLCVAAGRPFTWGTGRRRALNLTMGGHTRNVYLTGPVSGIDR